MGGIALNIKPPSGANSKKGNVEVLFYTWEHLLRTWISGEGKIAVRDHQARHLHQHTPQSARQF